MGLIAMEAPPVAVALGEVKAFLRVATSEEDALIAGFVRSASAACETFTGLALVAREVRETVAPGAWRRLGAAPVQAIEAVAAVAEDGAETPLVTDSYRIDIDAAGDGWVRVPSDERRARVRYTAGLAADWNGLPEPLRHGIVRLAAHLYAARGEAEATPPPASRPCGDRGGDSGSVDVRELGGARGASRRSASGGTARAVGRADGRAGAARGAGG